MVAKSGNLNSDDSQSYINDANGNVAKNVVQSGGLAIPPHDTITVTYPTDTTEVYTYSLLAVTVATVTLTYTDACKDKLLSAVRS